MANNACFSAPQKVLWFVFWEQAGQVGGPTLPSTVAMETKLEATGKVTLLGLAGATASKPRPAKLPRPQLFESSNLKSVSKMFKETESKLLNIHKSWISPMISLNNLLFSLWITPRSFSVTIQPPCGLISMLEALKKRVKLLGVMDTSTKYGLNETSETSRSKKDKKNSSFWWSNKQSKTNKQKSWLSRKRINSLYQIRFFQNNKKKQVVPFFSTSRCAVLLNRSEVQVLRKIRTNGGQEKLRGRHLQRMAIVGLEGLGGGLEKYLSIVYNPRNRSMGMSNNNNNNNNNKKKKKKNNCSAFGFKKKIQ